MIFWTKGVDDATESILCTLLGCQNSIGSAQLLRASQGMCIIIWIRQPKFNNLPRISHIENLFVASSLIALPTVYPAPGPYTTILPAIKLLLAIYPAPVWHPALIYYLPPTCYLSSAHSLPPAHCAWASLSLSLDYACGGAYGGGRLVREDKLC